MFTSTGDINDERGRQAELVYDREHRRLRRYFMRQVGSAAEADGYVRETFGRLSAFMEGRDWKKEEECLPAYLIRLAGTLYLEKLSEKNSRGGTSPAGPQMY